MSDIAMSVRVMGRVQGVWFRGWTRDTAEALGLSGWVRNAPDGSVEALIAGPENRVHEMLRRMEQGPPAARVVAVETETTAAPDQPGFRILR